MTETVDTKRMREYGQRLLAEGYTSGEYLVTSADELDTLRAQVEHMVNCAHACDEVDADNERLKRRVESFRSLLRCAVTGNPCGTDTRLSYQDCNCGMCSSWRLP